jgi:hypothetical protein
MKWTLVACLLVAGCVATQEEPASKQAEAYLRQLGQKVTVGMPLQKAIAEIQSQGFKCYEPARPPIPMGHTVVCNPDSTQAWGIIMQADGEPKLTAIRTYERTAAKH